MKIIFKIKKHVKSTYELILTFSRSSVNYIIDALDRGKKFDAVVYLMLLVLVYAILILLGLTLVKLAINNLPIIIVAGILLIIFLRGEKSVPPRKPTPEDYQAVLAAVKPALATVAPALGLAPIYEHTNIAADPEEQILPWGKVWRMKYKVLQQNATGFIDKELCHSIIQAQIKSVLEGSNPSGFANARFQRGGIFVPIIQVDEVLPGDAFLYLFVVIASHEYFQQKTDWENRKNVLPTGANTDDKDF